MITSADLLAILPNAGRRADLLADPINSAMDEFDINTPARQAAFIAQIGHESGQLRYVEELASGQAYEGRHDLGNSRPGDGRLYKGRGLIQITGRANYASCSADLFGDESVLIDNPERLCEPELAARSAAWFWQLHGLNELADAGNFERITRRINGGLNGQAERLAFWERSKAVLA